MSNTYKMTNANGEIRRARSLTTFHEHGDVYFDIDGFHFVGDSGGRYRSSWDHVGHVTNAAERFVLESYGAPVLVQDETQGDMFISIYGVHTCGRDVSPWHCGGPTCSRCNGLQVVGPSGWFLYGENLEAYLRWKVLQDEHRALEQARRMRREAAR